MVVDIFGLIDEGCKGNNPLFQRNPREIPVFSGKLPKKIQRNPKLVNYISGQIITAFPTRRVVRNSPKWWSDVRESQQKVSLDSGLGDYWDNLPRYFLTPEISS